MSSDAFTRSFRDLSDDCPPAREAGARVAFTLDRDHHIRHLWVSFAGPKPPNGALDKVLRASVTHAAAQDSSFDIFVHTGWIPDADTPLSQEERLHPYGIHHSLCFDARLRQIGVRENGRKRFAKTWPVEDVASVCRLAYGEHEPLPLHDYEDGDDDDDAAGALRAVVVRWIWYGHHTPEEIDQLITDEAADDDEIDAGAVRALAATVLARKRKAEAGWPEVTDNDRLSDAFADLIEEGILAVQWAGDTLDEGFDIVNQRLEDIDPGGDRHTGACFFHSQDIDRALNEEGLSVAFGHFHSDEPEDYIAVGRKVCERLRQHGLKPEWNGTDRQRIALPDFRWQRRTPG